MADAGTDVALADHFAALANANRLGRFLSVGAVGVVVDNAVLVALVEAVGASVLVASAVSKECAIVTMFLLNEFWTFADQGVPTRRRFLRRFLASNAVRVGGAAIAVAVLYVLHVRFGVWYLLANLVGIGVGAGFNYPAEALLTWHVVREEVN